MKDFTTSKSGLIHVVITAGAPVAAFRTLTCMCDFLDSHYTEEYLSSLTYYNSLSRKSLNLVEFLKTLDFCFSGSYPNLLRAIDM